LDVQNTVFSFNSTAGGAGLGGSGLGKGAAIFALALTTNPNGNNADMPSSLPIVTGCGNQFINELSSDAGGTSRDNADTYGADRVGLALACGDRIFADGFGAP
jgi:hypothetical protein